jgi:hypothetical protein
MERKKKLKQDCFTRLVAQTTNTECIKEYAFHPTRRWRFDYALPEYKVAIEVEGGVWVSGRHINPKGFLGDMEKYNEATRLGWHLIRCTPETQYSTATLDLIKETINNIVINKHF